MGEGGNGYQGGAGNGSGQGAGQHGGAGNGSGHQGFGIENAQLINVDIIIGVANIIILLILLYMYLGSYREFKSKFTFGLVAFTFLLLLQNVMFTVFLLTYQGFRGPDMGTPIFFLNIIEFFALSILLWVTRE
ncbi:MAG: hypothetical protein A4E27_01434 [Methanobacterium sp. PtaU1.Bin242]|nr:MAG: hypothetical protein A4E27_01434 [Methanobacterium sp. PtaU1.Bin242]